jgi:antitoxin (DNA-binding transcriptional repressor) of toxin-antitoxin stability system
MTTFSATAARDDFARILELVTVANVPVGITKYGNLVARVIPDKPKITKNWAEIGAKYAGMWANKDWVGKIGKPARKFNRPDVAL